MRAITLTDKVSLLNGLTNINTKNVVLHFYKFFVAILKYDKDFITYTITTQTINEMECEKDLYLVLDKSDSLINEMKKYLKLKTTNCYFDLDNFNFVSVPKKGEETIIKLPITNDSIEKNKLTFVSNDFESNVKELITFDIKDFDECKLITHEKDDLPIYEVKNILFTDKVLKQVIKYFNDESLIVCKVTHNFILLTSIDNMKSFYFNIIIPVTPIPTVDLSLPDVFTDPVLTSLSDDLF